MVYKWYILPIGGLYSTYHLLREPGNSIDFQGMSSLHDYVFFSNSLHPMTAASLQRSSIHLVGHANPTNIPGRKINRKNDSENTKKPCLLFVRLACFFGVFSILKQGFLFLPKKLCMFHVFFHNDTFQNRIYFLASFTNQIENTPRCRHTDSWNKNNSL